MRYCAGLLFPNYTDDLGKVSYVVLETRNDSEYFIMLTTSHCTRNNSEYLCGTYRRPYTKNDMTLIL